MIYSICLFFGGIFVWKKKIVCFWSQIDNIVIHNCNEILVWIRWPLWVIKLTANGQNNKYWSKINICLWKWNAYRKNNIVRIFSGKPDIQLNQINAFTSTIYVWKFRSTLTMDILKIYLLKTCSIRIQNKWGSTKI